MNFLYKLILFLVPPRQWRLPVMLAIAVFIGLGLSILRLSNATSYLSDDPKACINCHVMMPQYATWAAGSHGRVASCNDCHVPHDSVVKKYFFKAKDGSRHAFMYTFHMEPQVIRVKEEGMHVIQENCLRCHSNMFSTVERDKYKGAQNLEQVHAAHRLHDDLETQTQYCWSCHRETPHGRVSSLSSVPFARVAAKRYPLPAWLEKTLEAESKPLQSKGESHP